MYFIFFIICFGASILGAICGIGGGVIIKPVFDAFGVMNVETISFLSGCTVLLVILFFFFSMSTRTATENSLYIIFFSQIASLIQSIITASVPLFKIGILIIMASGGILGGICGRSLNMNMKEEMVDKLFIGLMVVMILVNIYNIYKFM